MQAGGGGGGIMLTPVDDAHEKHHGGERLAQLMSRHERPDEPVDGHGRHDADHEGYATAQRDLKSTCLARICHQAKGGDGKGDAPDKARPLLGISMSDRNRLHSGSATHGMRALREPIEHGRHVGNGEGPKHIRIPMARRVGDASPDSTESGHGCSRHQILQVAADPVPHRQHAHVRCSPA